MLKRPNYIITEQNTLFNLRGKFNSILADRILEDGEPGRHRIMRIEVRPDEFDRQGNLTLNGKASFWREIPTIAIAIIAHALTEMINQDIIENLRALDHEVVTADHLTPGQEAVTDIATKDNFFNISPCSSGIVL